jgi:hypothetical protein
MANKTLKALTNTIIKSVPQQSNTLDDSQKFSLAQNETLEITQYRSAPNNHWEIQLANPRDGRITWFAFISHLEIFVDLNFKPKLVETAIEEWDFFGQGTKKETQDGFWQRIVQYWREAQLNREDINTPAEVGKPTNAWSAAFISWLMTPIPWFWKLSKFAKIALNNGQIRQKIQSSSNKFHPQA